MNALISAVTGGQNESEAGHSAIKAGGRLFWKGVAPVAGSLSKGRPAVVAEFVPLYDLLLRWIR
jgi:hypothetical protein